MNEELKKIFIKQMLLPKEELAMQTMELLADKMNLQSKIDKAIEILDKLCVMKPWDDTENEMRKIYRPIKNTSKQEVYKAICDLRDILKVDENVEDN